MQITITHTSIIYRSSISFQAQTLNLDQQTAVDRKSDRSREMAYPGEYRREQILGEDGYPDMRSEYDRRSGYPTEAGYGVPYAAQGYEGRPYGEG